MSRPKLLPENLRARTVIFRVNEADYLRLAQNAAAAGLGVNQLARILTLSREAQIEIVTYKKSDPALINQLQRIGVNLNQLAKNSNIFGRVSPQVDELCELIAEIVREAAEKELGH